MPDGGDTMRLYGIGATWEVTRMGGAVTRAVTGVGRAVTEAAGVGAMAVGKYVLLTVTSMLARSVLESPS